MMKTYNFQLCIDVKQTQSYTMKFVIIPTCQCIGAKYLHLSTNEQHSPSHEATCLESQSMKQPDWYPAWVHSSWACQPVSVFNLLSLTCQSRNRNLGTSDKLSKEKQNLQETIEPVTKRSRIETMGVSVISATAFVVTTAESLTMLQSLMLIV